MKNKEEYYDYLLKQAEEMKYSKMENLFHHIATPFAMKLNSDFSKKAEEQAYGQARDRITRGSENLSKEPTLFLVNHGSVSDVSNLYNAVKSQFYIVADANQLSEKATTFFNSLIGAVYVKRCLTDEEEKLLKEGKYEVPYELSGEHAKIYIINKLLHGNNATMFFEGTWNMNYDELMLPAKWGAIDIAVAAGVSITPVNIEYLYDLNKTITTVLKPIKFSKEDDKAVAINEVRDAIANSRVAVREEHYGNGNAIGHYTKEELDEITIKNMMAYPEMPVMEELKCVFCKTPEEYAKRKEQYEYFVSLRDEAARRVAGVEEAKAIRKREKK